MSETIFGIDLGTTNSCLAVMEEDGPRVIEIEGQPIVPSVVSFGAGGEVIVGQRARNRLVLEPETTVQSIKRRMGSGDRIDCGGRSLLPEEIAAEILRFLKVQGELACGREVRRAVITVPAYFGDAQRRATIRAGELAGLEVERLLNEPTAAALVYDRLAMRSSEWEGRRRRSAETPAQRVLVYDLGGGTFDVSVVEIGGEVNEVRSSGGDNQLGGDDFDLLLTEHLLALVRERHGRDLGADRRARARLRNAAERAKIDLSSQPYARVMEEALAPGLHLDLEIDRPTFEALIARHLDDTFAEVDRALAEAGLGPDRINRVVLVGGSTRIPRIAERLGARFLCPVDHAVDPALGVALGAALQGAILGGKVFDQILVDVSAHSLGIKTMDNVLDGVFSNPFESPQADHFSVVIPRNTQIPATRAQAYFTVVDDQEQVRVAVYQGESELCSRNTLVGEFRFDLAPAPAGSPLVVEFSYDLDGIIRVVVSQKDRDRRKEVTLSTRTRGEVAEAPAGPRPVDNYILRKARMLAGALPAGPRQDRMREAAAAYEAALGRETEDPRELDRVESDLLELLEEAEEEPVSHEP